MPRKYKRKPGVVPRIISWTEDSLALAFEELRKKKKSFNEISRKYGIPSRTLRRRYEKSNQQLLTKGKYPVLGFENEKRLVADILKLGDAGFPPDRIAVRQLAYQFAEKLGLKHNFNNESKMAGQQWLKSFLERNSEIALRQAQGLSIERTEAANSGVSALEKRSEDSDQSLVSNERDQVSSLIKQEPGVCTLPESESNQGLHHQNELLPIKQEPGVCTLPEFEYNQDLHHQNELLPSGHQVPRKSEQKKMNQNHTPPKPSSSLLNSTQDCLDLYIKSYTLDNTEQSFPSLISLNESPSKFLHQASSIPIIQLSITKRSEQPAEILNSNDKIVQEKNKAKEIKKTNKITADTEKNKPAGDKKSIEKKKGVPQKKIKTEKYIGITSSETESDETDTMKQENGKTLRKGRLQIYSSDSSSSSESEENIFDSKTLKGKATEGLPIKRKKDEKSKIDTQKRLKIKSVYSMDLVNTSKNVSIDNYCAECLENYNFTKSKSDWIQYEMCRMWLNETYTTFKKYCMRCGKLQALASGKN